MLTLPSTTSLPYRYKHVPIYSLLPTKKNCNSCLWRSQTISNLTNFYKIIVSFTYKISIIKLGIEYIFIINFFKHINVGNLLRHEISIRFSLHFSFSRRIWPALRRNHFRHPAVLAALILSLHLALRLVRVCLF